MDGRERLLCTLKRETPDRVPVSFFVQEEYLSWFYPERQRVTRLADAVDCAAYYGFDITTRESQFTRPYWLKRSYPNWEIDEKTWVSGDIYYRQSSIRTPEKELVQVEVAPYDPRTLAGIHFHTREYFLKTPEDFEVFRKYFPDESGESREERHEMARHARRVIGRQGISCPWGAGGVYNQAAVCRDMQDLMMDPYTDPAFYKELMGFFTDWIVRDYEVMTETDYDALGIQGNIANGGLIGEDFFMDHVFPYEKRVVDTIRGGGKFSVYHNCGYAKNLYPCYKKLEMDVWETVSPPPQGDNSLEEAKEFFRDSLILSGNLDQVDFLKRASAEEVRDRVRETMETGKKGGCFIFAGSDFLERDTPEENVKAAVEAAVEFGGY